MKLENIKLTVKMNEIKQKIDQIKQHNLGVSFEIIGIYKTVNKNCIDITRENGKNQH